MWLLTSPANKQVLCSSKEDMFAYMDLHPDIPWTVRHVEVWTPTIKAIDKTAKLGRDFKPMSQE